MKDLLPYVNEKLSEVEAHIELSYNGISADLPLIVLTETNNSAEVITDGREWASSISIQTDIYAIGKKKVTELAIQVSEILINNGFRRSIGQYSKEDDLDRYMLQFDCLIDGDNRIYRGGNNI